MLPSTCAPKQDPPLLPATLCAALCAVKLTRPPPSPAGAASGSVAAPTALASSTRTPYGSHTQHLQPPQALPGSHQLAPHSGGAPALALRVAVQPCQLLRLPRVLGAPLCISSAGCGWAVLKGSGCGECLEKGWRRSHPPAVQNCGLHAPTPHSKNTTSHPPAHHHHHSTHSKKGSRTCAAARLLARSVKLRLGHRPVHRHGAPRHRPAVDQADALLRVRTAGVAHKRKAARLAVGGARQCQLPQEPRRRKGGAQVGLSNLRGGREKSVSGMSDQVNE